MTRHLLVAALLMLCALLPRQAEAQSAAPSSGSIVGWGWNEWGQIDPATCCNTKPFAVNGPPGPWSAIATGTRVTTAVRPDGTVWEWGQSDNSTTCTLLCPPAPVPGLHDVVGVANAAIDVRLALERDGSVWQWQSVRQRPPFQVPGLPPIAQIAVGDWYALALGRDGSVWQWSYTSDPKADVQPHIVTALPPAVSIAAGSEHALALTAGGKVWTWGNALGLAGGNPRAIPPSPVPGLENIRSVAAGDRFSLALDTEGRVWSWGYNPYGELGLGTRGAGSDTPALIPALQDITALSAQAFHAAAARADGTIWTWGENQNAEEGIGANSSSNNGCGCVPTPAQVPHVTGALAVATGFFHDVALLAASLPPVRQQLGPCGPPPGPLPASTRLPLSVPAGAAPSQIVLSERLHRLYLLRPGRYDDAAGAYTCTGSFLALDARNGRPLAEPLVGTAPIALIVDDHANRLFVLDGGARDDTLHGDLRVFQESTGRLLAVVPFDGVPVGATLAVHAGHLFVPLTDVPSTDNHLALAMLGTGTGRLLAVLPLADPIDRPVVDEATNRVFLHGIGSVIALDASTGQQVGTIDRFLCSGTLYDDPADRRVIALLPGASHNGVGSLCVLDPRTLRVTGNIDYGPNAGAAFVLLDAPAHVLVVQEMTYGIAPPPAYLTLIDARNAHRLRQVSERFLPVAVDQGNGRLVAIDGRGLAEILDPHSWRVIRRIRIPAGRVLVTVERSPHRLIVVSGSDDNGVVSFYPL
jgi:alpha-tubulin suppressor-like RCC1 family protein